MYRFIWRLLPGGLPAKLITVLLLVTLAAALLWYLVFPWLELHVPLDQVTVGG
ncbi:hypothetical protein [Acrocarpospora catenulata]|uniref:hypothetical protein n=1 Tax=Acrocarpospora catenulata TaxID=2836182 RepID=UPI001BDA7968|nr:hypothetical protein [Acrocarpospora catenulata]